MSCECKVTEQEPRLVVLTGGPGQRELERAAVDERKAAVVLCDRGTVDGLAYWPLEEALFWKQVGSSEADELARYTAVIHLRTPSHSGGYDHANPLRIESADEAEAIDARVERSPPWWSSRLRSSSIGGDTLGRSRLRG